ncbi:helix-turn-helix domain-containing protein [Streptomyces sp. NPDC056470]|uniref:helix-turn-helix domain-containing protein n=1 Tax=Streptomyces sp. NPDC056470 TaxID=3345831 RepID=UPI0036BF1143
MTAAHMGLVFAADGLDGAEKLLLLAYCNRTDDHGYCWPGQKRLANDCGTSAATVKRVKKALVYKGLISSVRRVHPVTGDPITNLTRVNLRLLEQMARPKTAYDDNIIERLTFVEGAPLPAKRANVKRNVSDQLRAHSEPGPDLLLAQDEPTPGSTWAHPPVKMSPPPAQDEPLTLIDPSETPQPSLRPSRTPSTPAPCGASKENGRTEGSSNTRGEGSHGQGLAVDSLMGQRAAEPVQSSPGVDLLNAIAQDCGPEFLLTGKTLHDQALIVIDLLDLGWTPPQIRQVVAGPKWPDQIKTSREAVIAGRLRRAAAGPVPATAPSIPAQTPAAADQTWDNGHSGSATWTPPAWTGEVQHPLSECLDCGSPAVADGHDKCPRCLGWPECAGTCGISGASKRRVRPADPTGLCSACRQRHGGLAGDADLAQQELTIQCPGGEAQTPF